MNNTTSDVSITTTVAALSDQHLLQRIKELAALEHHLEVVVIDHLRELDRRRLYLTLGFSSLFDYAVRELGYSDASAWRRIKAMRLCAEVEGARERMQEGSLTLNAAAQLQHAFDRQQRKQAGGGRGAKAGAGPVVAPSSGAAPSAVARAAEPPTAPALDSSARQDLVEQAAGKSTRQVRELLAEVDPELAAPADRIRPLGAGRWELKAVIDDDCRQGLEQLKGLLSHVDPQMTLGQLLGRVVQDAAARLDPARPPRRRSSGSRAAGAADETSAPKDAPIPEAAARTAVSAAVTTSAAKVAADSEQPCAAAAVPPAATASTVTSAPKLNRGRQWQVAPATPARPRVRGRGIPAAVRRQVWERDRGCCSYVDRDSGRRCGSRHLLEVDHILPYAFGGGAEPDNLRLLCAAHHRHRHADRAAVRW